MTFENIQEIIAKDEHRCLELKKTTGELQDAMHSACAFLNTDGLWRGPYGGFMQGAGCARTRVCGEWRVRDHCV